MRTLTRRVRLLVVLSVVATGAAIAVPSAPAQDRDCGSFSTQASAQAYFIALGGPTSDPDRLDGDSDGVACESLPCPCSSGAGNVPTPVPSPVPTPIPTATPTPTPTPSPTPVPPGARRSARIVRVIDGDTLRVRLTGGRQLTVRLIGIDTPETKRPGVAVECGGAARYGLHEATRPPAWPRSVGHARRRPEPACDGPLRPDAGVRRRCRQGRPRTADAACGMGCDVCLRAAVRAHGALPVGRLARRTADRRRVGSVRRRFPPPRDDSRADLRDWHGTDELPRTRSS